MKSSKKKPDDIFPLFQEATKIAFQFLVTHYNFKLVSVTIDDSMAWAPIIGCVMRYRNDTTEVEVRYDWYEDLRGMPQVICSRLGQNQEGELDVIEGYNLDMLINERCPDKAVEPYQKDSIEGIRRTLNSYAKVLEECAQDILIGDFSVFPKLRDNRIEGMKGAVILWVDDFPDDLGEIS